MKIVEAVWEVRNIGCGAFEITLDKKDLGNIESVFETLREKTFSDAYVVVKLPVGNLKILHALEDDGFRFMETQFYLVERFAPLECPAEIENIMRNMERRVVPKTREHWENVISRITPGMFTTDRIALDPELGNGPACTRYQNWCRDLFDNPHSWMWILTVDGQEVSFGVNIRHEEKRSEDGILGGVFEPFHGMGYGVFQVLDRGKRMHKMKTVVSSNNPGMLRVYQNFGWVIYKEMYVLRKFCRGADSTCKCNTLKVE